MSVFYCDDRDQSPCPDCWTPAEYRVCEKCGAIGYVIDCGHMDQPRPIASGLCNDCADEVTS